jgi:hypothetical protein
MNLHMGLAFMFAGILAIAPGAPAAENFQRLTGAQIQARFAGMELTDEVHWGDLYQRSGVLITNEMGHKTTGRWRVERDLLCLDRGRELGSGCFEVWLEGKNVQLRNKESSLPLEGVLEKPKDRH